MLAFLPFWLEIYWTYHGMPYDYALPRALRLMRVLQLEHYTEAFTLIDDVFRGCKNTLVATVSLGDGSLLLVSHESQRILCEMIDLRL
jgi:hypothetical protein